MDAKQSTNALSEVLQWACSPRGGNNFYGRILNGCGRVNAKGLGTAGVTITPEGRYLLLCDDAWFTEQPRHFQIAVIVHEAAHLALSHVERGLHYRRIVLDDKKYMVIKPILNVAMDMAVNDVAVRPFLAEQGGKFEECREKLIWPEDRDYPKDLEFESYFKMLMEDLKQHGFDPNNHEVHMLANGTQCDEDGNPLENQEGAGGSGDGEEGEQESQGGSGEGEGEEQQKSQGGNGEGKEQQDAQGEGGGGSEGQPNKDGKGGGGGGYDPRQDANLPGWFRNLLQKQMCVHVDWEKNFSDMTEAEIERATDRAKREGKKIIVSAAKQTEKSRGTLPAGMEAVLDGLLEEPSIPWEIVFRGMLKSALSSKLQESTCMPSPSLFHLEEDGIEPYPGFQSDFTFHIDACFDTSGSVSDDEFMKFMNELSGIMRAEKGVSVRLVMFDAAIQYEKLMDVGDDLSERHHYTMGRFGYGGTDFTPPLKLVMGKDEESDWESNAERIQGQTIPNADLVVMFTDGYAPVEAPSGPIPDYKPPCPLIWALTPSGREDPAMGNRVLWITE